MIKNKLFLLIFLLYFVLTLGIIIFSYSQVDLNLTLSNNQIFQLFQQKMINIGYYQRPLSGFLLFQIIFFTSIIYFLILVKVLSGKLNIGNLRYLILISVLLIFAYPSFSHDIFNYMFDARIVTKYHLSPYFFKALDFPDDTWTRFMHWTHRYYPYGPGWLILTLIPSFLGVGKFVITLFLFKLMFIIFHILNFFLIYKISKNINSKSAVFAAAFYAFNPLIIFEGLISPHNEMIMLSFLLLSLYFLIKKDLSKSAILVFISVSIKYLSVIFLPLLLLLPGKILTLLKSGFYLWLVTLIPVIISREIYAWYFIPLIGIGALICQSRIIMLIIMSLSIGTIFRYLPYFYYGNYERLTLVYQNWFLLFGILTGLIAGFFIPVPRKPRVYP